jgi:hypothetical protein
LTPICVRDFGSLGVSGRLNTLDKLQEAAYTGLMFRCFAFFGHSMTGLTSKILLTLACLAFPVVWGVLVNWLFDRWSAKRKSNLANEPTFPDYQI